MAKRTRSRDSEPYEWRTVIHNSLDGPCGAYPRPWIRGTIKHEEITDEVAAKKTPVKGIRPRYSNKSVDHLVYRLGTTSAAQQGELHTKFPRDDCYWWGWLEGSCVPPLPMTVEKLKANTVGDPPDLSYSDVLERLENPLGNNFGETLGEIASIRGLLTNVGDLARSIKRLPNALTSASRRASRNRIRALKDAPEASLGAYLGVEFGWKQVGEDVARIIAFAKLSLEYADRLLREMGQVRRVSAVKRYSDVVDLGQGVVMRREFVTRVTYSYVYEYTGSRFLGASEKLKHLSILERQMKAFWGLKVSPSLLWNLSPASWLIDQIIPLGDLIDDVSNWQGPISSGLNLVFLGGTTSSKCKFTVEYPWSVWGQHQLSPQEYWAWDFPTPYPTVKTEGTHYVRKVLTGGPGRISFNRRFRPQLSETGQAYTALLAISGTRRKLGK